MSLPAPTAPDALHGPEPLDVPESVEFEGLGTVRLSEPLAAGKVVVVYHGEAGGRPVVVKIYKPQFAAKHASRHPLPIAEYEYARNLAFFENPELTRYVAEPFGFVSSPNFSAMAQELLDGELYYDVCRARGRPLEDVFSHLRRIVRHAHAAELYDIDLHATNVLVVNDGDEEIPKLFDFNRIAFHLHPRNPFEAAALRLRIIDERSRDYKKLRQFHDFKKFERRRQFLDRP